ncbi:MAG TPA: 2-dehydropantoate 2-reductase [Acidimicrobiales bacterium]|jgi:2-dehydropantoate 2-reductase
MPRFVIFGAGAIGGVIGGRLFEAGHDVVLIARGEHGRVLHDQGLELVSADGSVRLPIPTVGQVGDVGLQPDDVVILAMKSQDTIGAVTALAETAPPEIFVVCAQNGVNNERVVLRSFPRVYAMTVMCPATHLEAGRVQASSTPISGLLDLGCYPNGADATAEEIAAALETATFKSEARPDIMRWKYRKLLMNLANAATALCGPTEGLGPLLRILRDEGEAVLEAAGIDVASRDEDRQRRGDLLTMRPIDGSDRGGGSSWQSLARGLGTIEAGYLNGEIVLLARLHDVAAPANELLQRLANEAATARRPPGHLKPDDLLAQLPPRQEL